MDHIHLMLDLETLGNRINPVIAQISAVPFTLESGVCNDLPTFSQCVNTKSCERLDLEVCLETVKWWEDQSPEARKLVFDTGERLPITDVLNDFTAYIGELRKQCDRVYLWGNGIRADNVWLLSAYKAAGLKDPVEYNDDLDHRTLHYLAEKKCGFSIKNVVVFEGTPHNAIDDCKFQIACAVKMWEVLCD